MNTTQAAMIVERLLKRRIDIAIEADGCDDRFYLTELEWEAVEKLLFAYKGEL
jgi:hypothetical protein